MISMVSEEADAAKLDTPKAPGILLTRHLHASSGFYALYQLIVISMVSEEADAASWSFGTQFLNCSSVDLP